ncbi:MAG: amidase, partial [Candidatus Competibacterales bacterium]|nr:amidase [Candidatus Competibacterales bacterium]
MPLSDQPLTALARDLAEGRRRAAELAEAAGAAHRPELNAYLTWTPEFARRQAAAADAALAAGVRPGPLTGIPVSVKDHFGVSGLPVYAGTARELPDRWQTEGPVVTRLRRQLAVITGKTQAVELAFGGVGVNHHHGTPRNPWDAEHHRVPGGSSSGAGVSLQEGSALLALGTDTAGSVRIPASLTGCVGLKTSAGRWSTAGIVPLSTTLDTAGLLALSVADVAYGFAALDPAWDEPMAFLDAHDRLQPADLRIGVAGPELWGDTETGVTATLRETLDALSRAGARLQDAPLPETDDARQLLRQGSVVAAECDAFVERELPGWRSLLDPIVSARITDGGTISAREYLARLARHEALGRSAAARFAGVDVIAAPTVPIPPPRLDDVATLEDYRPRNL